MGRWPRLADQPEHRAGVRSTEENMPASSHIDSSTQLSTRSCWSPGQPHARAPRPAPQRFADELGYAIAWFADHHFSNYCRCASHLMLVARPRSFAESVRFVFSPRPALSMDGATLPTGWTSAQRAESAENGHCTHEAPSSWPRAGNAKLTMSPGTASPSLSLEDTSPP